MAGSEVELHGRIVWSKVAIKVDGLRMNAWRARVMFGCSTTDRVEEQGKWPCGVCKKALRAIELLQTNDVLTLCKLLFIPLRHLCTHF